MSKYQSVMALYTGRVGVYRGEIRTARLHGLPLSGLGTRHWLDDGALFNHRHTWLRYLPLRCYARKHATGIYR